MDRRLSALAELMRAETMNERRSAVRLIERTTGKHIDDLIRRGVERTLPQAEAKTCLKLMETYSADTMVQALDVILRRSSVSWQDIVAKGDRLSIYERIEHIRTGRAHPAAKRDGLESVRRDALPQEISGNPILWEPGRDLDGNRTIIFYMMEATHQDRMFRPLVPFIARGDSAIKVRQAAHGNRTIAIRLEDPGVRHQHIEAVPA